MRKIIPIIIAIALVFVFSTMAVADPGFVVGGGKRGGGSVTPGSASWPSLISTPLLPKFEAKLQAYRGVGGQRVRVLVMSDSTGDGGVAPDVGWPYQLANAFVNSGIKSSHDSEFSGLFANHATRITVGAGWAPDSLSKTVGGDPHKNSTTTNPITFTPSLPISNCRVWYKSEPGGGVLSVNVASLTPVTVSTDAALGISQLTWSLGGNTFANTTCVANRASGGPVTIIGFEAWDNSGVSIINTSLGGSAVGDWASQANAASWLNGVLAINPDLVIMAPGINSMPFTSLATYRTQVRNVITALQGAGIEILMMTPVPQNPTDGVHNNSVALQDGYVAVNTEEAELAGIPVAGVYGYFKSYAWSSAAGFARYVDTWVHPNYNGYAAISALAYSFLTANSSARASYNQTVTFGTVNSLEGVSVRGVINLSRGGSGTVVLGASNATDGSSVNSVFAGDAAGASASTAQNMVAVGKGAMSTGFMAGSNSGTAVGFETLKAVTGINNSAFGAQAGLLVSTGTDNTIIGYKVGSTVLTTGSRNLLIGNSNAITTPAAATSDWLSLSDVVVGSKLAPTASACGTGPVLATGTSDIRGTVTTGTGAAACTLTFATAKANAPTCIVTARSGTPPVYTTSTAALTLSTAAASEIYDYFCSGK